MWFGKRVGWILVVGGVLADALGIQAVYLLGGVLLLFAGILGFARLHTAIDRAAAAGAGDDPAAMA